MPREENVLRLPRMTIWEPLRPWQRAVFAVFAVAMVLLALYLHRWSALAYAIVGVPFLIASLVGSWPRRVVRSGEGS